MDHKRIADQLAAYSLGALDAAARQEVEQHLAGCAECRQLASELAETADLLPLALATASPVQPPDDLKARVLQAAQTPAPLSAGASNEPPRQWNAPWDAGRWRALAAAAAVIVLALSLAWGVRLSEALDQERALRERIAAHFTQQQEIVLEVVDADDATRMILRSPDPDSRAYGKLFTRPDLPHVVAMAARLPQPPAGQTYHLWLTSEGRTFLAGVLPVNDQGFGLLTFDADHDGPLYDAAQLTLQPPGAESPGGETVLTWSR
jgi:hypothetical protein